MIELDERLNSATELSDRELDAVTGGTDPAPTQPANKSAPTTTVVSRYIGETESNERR
jgi:hypothetical protein